tara:strand:- start:1006 stop:1329 length:324 start_codon:yes stop_codon:yes gene_type:complete
MNKEKLSIVSETIYRHLQRGGGLCPEEMAALFSIGKIDAALMSTSARDVCLSDEMSALAIMRRITKNPELSNAISGMSMCYAMASTAHGVKVIQEHNGTGDNIAGTL